MKSIENVGDLRVFEAVARLGSLTAAARDLGMPLSVLSKRLGRLERHLGRRLAKRSTRTFRLTAAGEGFLSPCRNAMKALDALGADENNTLNGRIRVSGSVAFVQRRLAPAMPSFLSRHPGVSVEFLATNSFVDLVREGVDLAFRQMPEDPSASGVRIAPDGHVLVASPQYLKLHGTPREPIELMDHACLTVGQPAPKAWQLVRGPVEINALINAVLSGSDGEPAHAAALADGGIAIKSKWDILEDIASGRLVHVLPQ